MKKIDLHIHTISTESDHEFTFSLEVLQRYVNDCGLDGIAITNHNAFALEQFEEIRSALGICVFPGIEIDLEGGQLLLIGDGENLSEFTEKAKLISSACSSKKSISMDDFQSIYQEISKYILIPHYEKKPQLKTEILRKLFPHVTAGEVSSPKKFMYCQKDKERLTPVYFSDCRIDENLKQLPVRQTYIDCEELGFSAIKSCLRDKHKVSLSEHDGNSIFQIFDNGQNLSTGLNVLVGGRSSGKSYTLDRIEREWKNVKYIKQFTLVARDEKEDQKKFNKLLSEGHSLFSKEYLDELEGVVNDVIDVDIEQNEKDLSEYIDSLLKFAKETEKQDAFSNACLFSEEVFQALDQKGLKELIASTQHLIENDEFRGTVVKHISIHSLNTLIVDLMLQFGEREQDRLKKVWLNGLIMDIKSKLNIKTATTPPTDISLHQLVLKKNKAQKFEAVVLHARNDREILRKPLKNFYIVARVGEFKGAGELQKLSKSKSTFSDAFSNYQNPYEYLQELKSITGLEAADIYRYFVKIDYKILNKDGAEASGGERSEFNLLQEVDGAQNYDMLLIDEPESSFDNLFLKDEVNEIIKDISSYMPVVLVTHNATVGASIKPDYLICARKEFEDRQAIYRLYSGAPTSKNLVSVDGEKIGTWQVLMGCLEAGEVAYNERRASYEDLKD